MENTLIFLFSAFVSGGGYLFGVYRGRKVAAEEFAKLWVLERIRLCQHLDNRKAELDDFAARLQNQIAVRNRISRN